MSDYVGEVNTTFNPLLVYIDERTNKIELQVDSEDFYLDVGNTKELIKVLQDAISQLGESK